MSGKELRAFRVDAELSLRLPNLLVIKRGVRAKKLGASKPKGGIHELRLTCSGFDLDQGGP